MSKELTYQTARISPEPKEGSWSTAFEFAPPSSSDKASRGILMAAASISASEKFEASIAGHQVLSALQEDYYSQTTGGILPALERAVTAAHQRLVTLVFSGEGEEEAVDFNLVVGVLWGSVFYLAQLGEARAVIRRSGELKLIGHRTGAEEADLAVGEKPDIRTASGLLEVGDKILLATPRFFDLIPVDELSRLTEAGGAAYISEKLKDRFAEEPAAAALVLTLGLEGTPSPAEEAAVLIEPAAVTEPTSESDKAVVEEALVEEVAAEPAAEEVVEVEAVEIEEGEPAEKEELAQAVSKQAGKFGRTLLSIFSKIGPLAVTSAKTGHRVARDGIWPRIKRGALWAWNAIGSPRTAVEGVSEARNRRTLVILAGALLIILLIGIGVNSLFKGDSGKKTRFDNLMTAAQAQYEEAQATNIVNKTRAKELLVAAQGNLKEADELDINDAKVQELSGRVGTLLEEVNQVFRVEPSVFYDLEILRVGAAGVDLAGDKSTLYVIDPTAGLYQIAVSDKKGSILSSDLSLSKAQSVVVLGDKIFTFVPQSGIFGYDQKTKKFSQTTKIDSSWGKIVDMASYTNNAYLLDSGKNVILRYTPVSAAQFGPATTWTKESTSLSGATGIAVDGSVWVAQTGGLLKFSAGKQDSFLPQDVIPSLSDVKAVYSTTDNKNIYLLESGRLVVIDKSGIYQSQYVSDKLASAAALVVDEAGKRAYILAESKILQIDLK